MADQISLIKSNPLLPAEDYVALRREGIKQIEKLANRTWTDYNESDPGITMLEALCYAITDLAYRTGFELKDLLAPEEYNEDTWKQIFYTARQILHTSPLTANDYRKMMIDVKGVRNAWIEPSKEYEVPVWVNYNYFESRKEESCDCEGMSERSCFGQLGLSPVSKEDAQKNIEQKIAELEAKVSESTKAVQEIEIEIKKIEDQLVNEKDPEIISKLEEERNALLQKRDGVKGVLDQFTSELQSLKQIQILDSKIVEFEGLYNVMIEYEEDVVQQEHREEIRQLVIDRLLSHRNLCEDYLGINAIEYDDISIAASIALEETADPDVVVAEIFFTLYKYFTPSVAFYTIEQMMAKGYQADEIFEGPPLMHGFIDATELDKTDLYRDIRLSDIINEISDIEGVRAITYFSIPFNGFENSGKNYFSDWVDQLRQQQKIARVQPGTSQILLCKERDFITYNTGSNKDRNTDRMLKLFRDLKSQERKYKLDDVPLDFEVPAGENMELEDYYPVTYSLPMCYGVSERAGLPSNADEKRKVQALQLKGYLMVFEQMLTGYLSQLNHLRDLFSFDDTVEHTYFTRALYSAEELTETELAEIEDLKLLIIDHQKRGEGQWNEILNDFNNIIQNLLEPVQLFHKRRNQFLDHLLARFGEDMSEYAALSKLVAPCKSDERLIGDKIRLLKDGEYYRISSNRAKGYNYSNQQYWNTPNVSGSERRIGRLLGFKNIQRRNLTPDIFIVEAVMVVDEKTKMGSPKKNKKGQSLNVVKLVDPDNRENVLLTSVEVPDGCCTELLMLDMLKNADTRKNFQFVDELKQRSRKSAGLIGNFSFVLYDGPEVETAVLLAHGTNYENRQLREKMYDRLHEIIEDVNNNEGMHLVEHILLRPRVDEILDEANGTIPVSLPDICLDVCDLGIGLGENTQIPLYRKKISRTPAEKCYDNMPWVLEYFRKSDKGAAYDLSFLFQKVFPDNSAPQPLKFRRFEQLSQRVQDINEYGSERMYYQVVSNDQEGDALKYSFIIQDENGNVLAQSLFIFNRKTKKQESDNTKIADDIEEEIARLMEYFGFETDWYCAANPCDNNEDPFSFRTTVVLPCWPKRFRDATYRNFVEKTIVAQSPAHIRMQIHWVGMQEMRRFEDAYAGWLLEMAQTEMPGYEKVNPLVEVLNTLKPCGACEDDCSGS
jgi:hypothetical protein